ncbi:S1C family serine protease [Lentzea pudingi]|uniref:S1C family serine protease n=1 Tax=Lentzea pudingi TaxID=1789439 RepID=UPI00166CFC75|nr:S1C family serine protease [Lentzea pudingi]
MLRVAVAAEFIGHGAFGVMGKDGWLPYYAVFGIEDSLARNLMPITGLIDIALGVLVLLRPTRLPLAFMGMWGLFTAALRPLAGEGVWEFLERAYNFGVPLGLLLLAGLGSSWSSWLGRIRQIPRLDPARARRFGWGFRLVISIYLIGHGGLGVFSDKPSLIRGYDSVGLTNLVADSRTLNLTVGLFEIGVGLLVLVYPAFWLSVFVVIWKLVTELLFVTMGARGAWFEVIERGGAYAAPVVLILLMSIIRGTAGSGGANSVVRGFLRSVRRRMSTLRMFAVVVGVMAVTACATPAPPTGTLTSEAARDSTGSREADRELPVDEVLLSVVSIEAQHSNGDVIGTGFRVAIPGIVVTNAHIVRDAAEVTVVIPDGTRRTGQVLGKAVELDIGVVRVDDGGLPPLHSGSGLAGLRVGDQVFAVGSSGPNTLATATVTALAHEIRVGSESPQAALRTDTALDPRLTGGPLLNRRGEVVGVTTVVADDDSGDGFAIPVTDARAAVFRIVGDR